MPTRSVFSLPDTFDEILASPGVKFMEKRRHVFVEQVALALAELHTERKSTDLLIPRHRLNDDLKRILRCIIALGDALRNSREAEDLMVRARWPKEDVPTGLTSPTARPYFSGLVEELRASAEMALAHRGPLPYVASKRGRVAETAFIEHLLGIWHYAVRDVPTFAASSSFVRLVRACFEHVGVRCPDRPSLAKRCARLFKSGGWRRYLVQIRQVERHQNEFEKRLASMLGISVPTLPWLEPT